MSEFDNIIKNVLYIPGIVCIEDHSESITLKKYLREYFDTDKTKYVIQPPRIVNKEDVMKGLINPKIVFGVDEDLHESKHNILEGFLEYEEQK